jgi:hypothetical protein
VLGGWLAVLLLLVSDGLYTAGAGRDQRNYVITLIFIALPVRASITELSLLNVFRKQIVNYSKRR